VTEIVAEMIMLTKRTLASLIGLALPLSGLLLPDSLAGQSFTFSTIDVPCSACPKGIALSTTAQGINPAGDIVGSYVDAAGRQHGFLLSRGEFTTIDVPGELMGVTGILPTVARGISPSGDIVGSYTAPVSAAPFGNPEHCLATKPASCTKGFLFSRGTFSTVLYPLPSGGYHPGAIPQRITPDRSIYACFHDYDTGASMFGAAWTHFGDISLLPNGGELANADPLAAAGVPMSMNNGATPDGQTIVGLWIDMMVPSRNHGYIVQNGNFQSYDAPNSTFTRIWDINPAGAFVGVYTSDKSHGFLQLPPYATMPVTLDLPAGFPANISTTALGINPGGAIVGQYTDHGNHVHGFLAVPAAPVNKSLSVTRARVTGFPRSGSKVIYKPIFIYVL
jgi:hypothetical protein